MLPLGVRQILFQGAEDPISPPALGQNYVAAATAYHDDAQVTVIPASGHVELISPGTAAWDAEAAEIVRLAKQAPR
jgi:pimeloyl-ACP methyl ester carboxylesterase